MVYGEYDDRLYLKMYIPAGGFLDSRCFGEKAI